MKKRLLIVLFVFILIVGLLVACDEAGSGSGTPSGTGGDGGSTPCVHVTDREATCTEPSLCTKCGDTIEPAKGHDYVNSVCTRCGGITLENDLLTIEKIEDDYVVKGVRSDALPVTEIIIPSFVTAIYDYALRDYTGVHNIVVPSSVTYIGIGAFKGCRNLESITLPFIGDTYESYGGGYLEYLFDGRDESTPSGLTTIVITGGTSIGSHAFNNWAVTDVTLPEGLLRIESNAFEACGSLSNIVIPDSVEYIGNEAFLSCAALTDITIPASVETIDTDAFAYSGLTSVIINNGVNTIGAGAFRYCEQLTGIVIPDSVESIGDHVFYRCGALRDITIPFLGRAADASEPRFSYIFSYHQYSTDVPASLKNVVVTGGTAVAEFAFYDCNGLESIALPDGITVIGQKAFLNCSSLKSITIPSGVTSIGYNAFLGCIGLVSATIGGGEIGNEAFLNCIALENVTLGDGVTGIGQKAFNGCISLKSITIPSSVTSIGRESFSGCDTLEEVVIGDGVTSIGQQAFENCVRLKNLTIGSNVETIGEASFKGCKGLQSLIIPSSVTTIEGFSFNGCSGLISLTVGSGVTSIGNNAFSGCGKLIEVYNLSSLDYVWENALDVYTSLDTPSKLSEVDGYIIRTVDDSKVLLGYKGSETDLVIPEEITEIYYAFFGNKDITSVVIPSTVTRIGKAAFCGCSRLVSIDIPDSVQSIDDLAFWGSGLVSLTLGSGVKSIGNIAFYECYKLVEVYNNSTLSIAKGSDSYGYVGYCALDLYNKYSTDKTSKLSDVDGYIIHTDGDNKILLGYKGSETDLVIPEGVTEIYRYAFWGHTNITSVVIPDSVEKIDNSAFLECKHLTSVTFGANASIEGSYVFLTTNITTVVIDSQEIAGIASYNYNDDLGLYKHNPVVYVKDGIEVPDNSVLTSKGYVKADESDMEGYQKYTK